MQTTNLIWIAREESVINVLVKEDVSLSKLGAKTSFELSLENHMNVSLWKEILYFWVNVSLYRNIIAEYVQILIINQYYKCKTL